MMKWTELTVDEQIAYYNKEIWFVVSMWSEYTDCTMDAPETDDIFVNINDLSTSEALERLEKIYGLSKSELHDYPGEDDYIIAYYFHEDREYVIQHGSGSEMGLIIDNNIKYI